MNSHEFEIKYGEWWQGLSHEGRLQQIALARERYRAAATESGMNDAEIGVAIAETDYISSLNHYAEDSLKRWCLWCKAAAPSLLRHARIRTIYQAFNCTPRIGPRDADNHETADRRFLAAFDHWKRELKPIGAVPFADYAEVSGAGIKTTTVITATAVLPDAAPGSATKASPRKRGRRKGTADKWTKRMKKEGKRLYSEGQNDDEIAVTLTALARERKPDAESFTPGGVAAKRKREKWTRAASG